MKHGPEPRTRVRCSFHVATVAAAAAAAATTATSLLATHANAYLYDGASTTRLPHRAHRLRSSSRCILQSSSSNNSGRSSSGRSSRSSSRRASPISASLYSSNSNDNSNGRIGRRRPLPRSIEREGGGAGGGGGGGGGAYFPDNIHQGRLRAVVPLGSEVSSTGSGQPRDAHERASAKNEILQPSSSGSGGVELSSGQSRNGNQRQRQQQGSGGRRPSRHITDETLDLIRASTSITEVISQHVEMHPAGRGMVGCCPFHDDRTPSFSVDESRGFYHCFGCGASGDVITFLMQIDGLGFREVVADLAEEAGISLGFDDDSEGGGDGSGVWGSADEKVRREARERLSLVLQMAAQFYTRCLVEMPAAGGARAHIIERGISPMTVMDFQLGYSPADLTSPLIEYLDQEGFEMDTLVDAGLVPDTSRWKYRSSSNNPQSRVDRFRGRLVVPIRDHRGLVIGFGARDLSDSQAQNSVGSGFVIPEAAGKGRGKGKGKRAGAAKAAVKEAGLDAEAAAAAAAEDAAAGNSSRKASLATLEAREGMIAAGRGEHQKQARTPAKYLNSPETSLFKKGKNVFGLDLAKEAIRSEDCAFVVEGYFDVIKLHDAGIRSAVGVLGTAITIDQLQLCARYSKNKRVVLCMDGDAAGQRAVERLCESPASSGLDALSEAGVSVSVATIPKDSGCKDPADFLQAHGAEEFRAQVMEKAAPWSNWYGDRILAEHDFAGDANAFRKCTDRLTSFMSDLSIPTDQTFHVHRFAKALAGGNEVMRHQLEFDLMNMSNEKRTRKNALRRRVASSSATPPPVPSSTASSDAKRPGLETPGTAMESPPPSSAPGAELRRLASGRSTEPWGVEANSMPPKVPGQEQHRRVKRYDDGGVGTSGGHRVGSPLTGKEGMEGVAVHRNYEWVMERVKMRKREESKLQREKYRGKDAAIWSPVMEQEYGASSEEGRATELALRGRILDQAQRFLLALVVHDPTRRTKCAEEVSRHGLSLGSERRQWLFEALTASSVSATMVAATEAAAAAAAATGGREEEKEKAVEGAGQVVSGDKPVPAHLPAEAEADAVASSTPVADVWGGPSTEALEAGGDMLFAEVRAAAPAGYFGLRGKAAAMASTGGNGVGEAGASLEETLDWAFGKAEADRVAKRRNTDLVLLEVVMVMLKEQAAARMHSLSQELAETSDAIARTMAEAAAANLVTFDPLRGRPERESPPAGVDVPDLGAAQAGEERAVAGDAAPASQSASTSDATEDVGGGSMRLGRSKEEAQAEVDRLKIRQAELFEMISEKKQEVIELDAQRKAFTSRLPKVKAESEAIRHQEEARSSKSSLKAATEDRVVHSSPFNPRRSGGSRPQPQQQQAAGRERGSSCVDGAKETVEEGEVEGLTPEDLPYRFLAEDQEPEEGFNVYDVEANVEAARAARAAQGVRDTSSPPQQRQLSSSKGMPDAGGIIQQVGAGTTPRHGRHDDRHEDVPPHPSVGVDVPAGGERVKTPSTPGAPPQHWQQQRRRLIAEEGDTENAGADVGDLARDARGSVSGGRRERVVPLVASGEASSVVTLLGRGPESDVYNDSLTERMAMEAEEQTDQTEECDAFDGSDGMMRW